MMRSAPAFSEGERQPRSSTPEVHVDHAIEVVPAHPHQQLVAAMPALLTSMSIPPNSFPNSFTRAPRPRGRRRRHRRPRSPRAPSRRIAVASAFSTVATQGTRAPSRARDSRMARSMPAGAGTRATWPARGPAIRCCRTGAVGFCRPEGRRRRRSASRATIRRPGALHALEAQRAQPPGQRQAGVAPMGVDQPTAAARAASRSSLALAATTAASVRSCGGCQPGSSRARLDEPGRPPLQRAAHRALPEHGGADPRTERLPGLLHRRHGAAVTFEMTGTAEPRRCLRERCTSRSAAGRMHSLCRQRRRAGAPGAPRDPRRGLTASSAS